MRPHSTPGPLRSTWFRRALATCLTGILVASQAPSAQAWGTAEHIQFGDHIADPFEAVMGPLPVIESTLSNDRQGPRSFAHWVSAPDFGRSLGIFLNLDAIVGDLACAVLWNDRGVIIGADEFHDQSFVEGADETIDMSKLGLLERRAHLDCIGLQAVNNNHFGDFARIQFRYYHEQALEAARRFRATRNPGCQKAAYTLEGWGQHYLTDSTAAGHAWNPPGSYEDDGLVFTGKFINKLTGLPIRFRIHQQLNGSGARMSGSMFEMGTFWGDHSENHAPLATTVPDSSGDNAQRDVTMRMARMALGDVVAATECGATTERGDSIFLTRDQDEDPRRFFVSNDTMCDVMWRFVPRALSKLLFQHPLLDQFVDDCDAGSGVYKGPDPAGAIFSQCYFKDVFENTNKNTCEVSETLDSRSLINLEDLGCPAHDRDFPNGVRPLETPDQVDMCGNSLCETPIGVDGSCPFGMDASAGCCVPEVSLTAANGIAEMGATWSKTVGEIASFETEVAYPGAPSSFMWADAAPVRAGNSPTEWKSLSDKTQRFEPATGLVSDCTGSAQSTRYETQIRLPASANLEGQALYLSLVDFDEAVRVRVDGRLIGTFDRSAGQDKNSFKGDADLAAGIRVQLLTPGGSNGDQGHRLELTHLNSCDGARPLKVRLSVDEAGCLKCDDLGSASEVSGCSVGGQGAPLSALLLLLAMVGLARRKQD